MLIEQTVDKMNLMKLSGMAEALRQQLATNTHAQLAFDERLGLLVDAEWTAREQRKLSKRLRSAKLRYAASLEDIDFKHPRTLDRQQVLSLGNCAFVEHRHNLLIIGPTGIGKSYLACAFVERACRRGYKGALRRIEPVVQGKAPRTIDQTERNRFFEAYAMIAGAGSMELLGTMLSAGGLFKRKEPVDVRAAAALALGRLKSAEARAILEKHKDDKELVVRAAVSRALREGGAP